MAIKELRVRAGLTQQGMAIKFGIPKKTIENWEQGVSSCPNYVEDLIKYKMFKEGMIVNNKITYRHTSRYDNSLPDNNFETEAMNIVTDGVYDFKDFLSDRGVEFEEDSDCDGLFWVTEYGERTGEAYMVIKEEPTDEDLHD